MVEQYVLLRRLFHRLGDGNPAIAVLEPMLVEYRYLSVSIFNVASTREPLSEVDGTMGSVSMHAHVVPGPRNHGGVKS